MNSPQRAYRAACPNCGAPVEFASAASASAVCGFCRSTLVRDGDALRRIGVSAELFDDHSPLQLGAAGVRQGMPFTLVGRVQHAYGSGPTPDGTWNEWHALFDTGSEGGRSAWLSEDNGAYVLAFDAPLPSDAPDPAGLRAGQRVVVDGRGWDVASVVRARVLAAQGELPRAPRLQGSTTIVDLRNAQGEVATLEAGAAGEPPAWSVGRSVSLADLRMTGLREGESEKTLSGRSLACPNCGAALTLTLASTKSVTCGQCASVVDVSQGMGGDLAFYQQNNSGADGREPQLPLGRTGTLALGGPPLPWQVVGYMERCSLPQDAEDDTVFWREYLLYHRTAGFAFLVDSNEGWSWVRPLTGAPSVSGSTATWQGVAYQRVESYAAKVTWVQGEFYWAVRREERALVIDYTGRGASASKRLSREKTADEVTWSAGEALDSAAVATAFGIDRRDRAALVRDATPASSGKSSGVLRTLLLFIVIVVVMVLASRFSQDDCDEVRQTFGESSAEYQQCQRSRASGGGSSSGGSYGGWSSGGGGHK